MNDEEISCNLKRLKQYSRDFDIHEARWKASYGKKDAYEAMMEAERSYVSLSGGFGCKVLMWCGRETSKNMLQKSAIHA